MVLPVADLRSRARRKSSQKNCTGAPFRRGGGNPLVSERSLMEPVRRAPPRKNVLNIPADASSTKKVKSQKANLMSLAVSLTVLHTHWQVSFSLKIFLLK
jgi:hypothetical protein